MTKYLIKRILRALFSVIIVVAVIMVMVYAWLDREAIFGQDPNYPKMLNNKQVSKIIRHNNARVLEINSAYVLVEKTGKTEEIVTLYKEFVAEQCLLQYVKSGRVAITRDYNEDLSEQLFNEDAKRKGIN